MRAGNLTDYQIVVSRIVINTCLNQLRSEKVRPELRMSDLSEEQAVVVEKLCTTEAASDEQDALAAREVVELLLDHLSPDDRLLINLLHLEGRSVQEVADLTGWSRTGVKVRAFRARGRMRRQYLELQKKETSK